MKSIIMSTEDVWALLDGRKTMARRVVNPQPTYWDDGERVYDKDNIAGPEFYAPIRIDKDGEQYPGKEVYGIYSDDGEYGCKAPCQPGDVLWVRETFFEYKGRYHYKADDKHKALDTMLGSSFFKWHPSIHMPREAARLFLRVTDVRVERVQDISGHDAELEGFRTECGPLSSCPTCNVSEFHKTWDARNAKRGYGWDTNPFCWVIEFKRVEKGAES